jgi:divalent metal cation (Fe/Co/Zn/Cd) transporter
MLFSLGGLFAVYEGIEKLLHPHELESVAIALAVLGVAIVLEALSFRTAFVEASAVKGDESWWHFIRRSKSPELPVVLLEDTGALLGLVLAFVGITAADVTGNPRWDAVGSIGIGILLVVITIVLAAEMKSLLIGESAAPQMEEAIRGAIVDGPEVRRIIHLRTLHLGPDELLVAAKIDVDSDSMPDLSRAIDATETRVRAAVPIARVIYLEPDLFRSDAPVDR